MRTLEIALLVVNLPVVLRILAPSRPASFWFHALPLCAGLVAMLQITCEGYRWQMLPAYLLTVLFVIRAVLLWNRPMQVSYVVGAGCLGYLFAAALLPTLMPVFEFPVPSGPYKVGTVIRHLVDASRREVFSPNPQARRELMAQIWYPAEAIASGVFASYREQSATSFKFAHLALVKTHSVLGAKPVSSPARFPVLIFSPSWTGPRSQNTFQVEDLASHGFVVVGMDHPYGTAVTVLPDGRTVRSNLGKGEDYSSEAAFDEFLRSANDQIRTRAEDARFVLDQLAAWNVHDPGGVLTGRLDLDRVGIFGHSLGGGVAAETCWLDPRFKAGINFDGMMAEESGRAGIRQPFLFVVEDAPPPDPLHQARPGSPLRREEDFGDDQAGMIDHSLAQYAGYYLKIHGATHANYSDTPLIYPLRWMSHAGPIHPDRCMSIINAYTRAFFDLTLNHTPQPLFSRKGDDYPEAELRFSKGIAHADPSARP